MFSPVVLGKLETAIDLLAHGKKLPGLYADHQLQGEYSAYRECHIKGDLLLMYRIDDSQEIVELADIGSHSQLFG